MRKTVSEGDLGFLEMLMISFSRGTPSVTFLEETPAKWKVLAGWPTVEDLVLDRGKYLY